MALNLMDREQVLFKVDLHWSSYLVRGSWETLGAILILSSLIVQMSGHSDNQGSPNYLVLAFVFFGPLLVRVIQNRCKVYAVTDKRIYVEEGIVSKSKQDIPFSKINDIQMTQSVLQRLFGSGTVVVYTGNSKPTKITDIDSPNQFKEKIFQCANAGQSKDKEVA